MVLTVIGEILPLAVGIALSPTAIIAAILILVSANARVMSLAFMVGWIIGIVVATVAFTVLSSLLPEDQEGPAATASVITIVFGLLLVLVAQRLWRKRPAEGEHGTLPKWMSAIDSMSPVKGLALGFLLAAVPKNLLLDGSAGMIIGSAPLSLGQNTASITIFTVLAACTVLIPVIGYLVAPTPDGRAARDAAREPGGRHRHHHGGVVAGDRRFDDRQWPWRAPDGLSRPVAGRVHLMCMMREVPGP